MVTYLYMINGVSIYYAESMEVIADNLREVKPQIFTTVPRLLEKVYDKIVAKGHELEGVKKEPVLLGPGPGPEVRHPEKPGLLVQHAAGPGQQAHLQ